MTEPFLTQPDPMYRDSFLAMVREFQDEGRWDDFDLNGTAADFDSYCQDMRAREHTPPAPGWVTETVGWLIVEGEVAGRLSLRHTLTDNLRQFGGHIGYEIRPSMRQRGYGTLICKLGLEKARAQGIDNVLITCDDTNIASARIIEKNGGVLQDTIQLPERDVPTRRYWVALV